MLKLENVFCEKNRVRKQVVEVIELTVKRRVLSKLYGGSRVDTVGAQINPAEKAKSGGTQEDRVKGRKRIVRRPQM